MSSIDIFVNSYISSVRTPFITDMMYVLTSFFDVTSLASAGRFILLVLCFAALIYLVRNLKFSILFVFSLFSGAIITYLLKIFFNIARPAGAVISVFGQSFPSYHATASTIFFVMLMYIFDSHLGKIARIIFNSVCIVAILLIATSRIYLGVHWLSDVLGGIVLGVFLAYILIKLFNRFQKKL